ncbi:MAG: hypothetical protein AAGH79_04000 [Bacteroidota bacterium]
MPRIWHRIFCAILLVGVSVTAQGQDAQDNSPYSRLGLGDLVNQQFAANLGMGGLTAAFADRYHTNIVNPASLASLKSTAFEVGLYAKYANLNAGAESVGVWSGNLNYLSLAFPIRNQINQVLDRKTAALQWGMAFTLIPFTNVGYDVETAEETDELGTTLNSFQGSGGTYKLLWGNGISYKDFSFGVNLGYLFGKITNERRVAFSDIGISYENLFNDEMSVSGWTWNLGVQYKYSFKKGLKEGEEPTKSLIIGVYGNSMNTINTNTSRFYVADNPFYPAIFTDTLVNDNEVLDQATLPAQFAVGVMYEEFEKFRLGAEYTLTQWSNYDNPAKPEQLTDAYRLAIGGEFIPNINSYNRYAAKIRYRLGGFFETDPRSFNTSLTNYGVTFGVGLPVIMTRGRTSFVNFAVEAGQFGSADNLRETYARMTLGFTLNDNSWFFKRKFN